MGGPELKRGPKMRNLGEVNKNPTIRGIRKEPKTAGGQKKKPKSVLSGGHVALGTRRGQINHNLTGGPEKNKTLRRGEGS